MSITALPSEVFALITALLPEARDKMALAVTCTQFFWVLEWRHQSMNVRLSTREQSTTFGGFLRLYQPRFPRLELHVHHPDIENEEEKDPWHYLGYIPGEDWKEWDFTGLVDAIRNCKEMTTLDLHTNLGLPRHFFSKLPTTLRSFRMTMDFDLDEDLISPMSRWTALEHLHLDTSDRLMISFPGLPETLRTVRIPGECVYYVEIFIEAGQLPALEELEMGQRQFLNEHVPIDLDRVEDADVVGDVYKCISKKLDVSKTLKTYRGYPAFHYVPSCLEHIVVDSGKDESGAHDDLQALVSTCRTGQTSNNLRSVSINRFNLALLSHHIGKIHHLESLDVSRNNITMIHESIGRLPNLASLSLASNNLTRLPIGLAALTSLTHLDLSNNPDLRDVSSDVLDKLFLLRHIDLRDTGVIVTSHFSPNVFVLCDVL